MRTHFKKFLMVVAGLAWLNESNGEPGWRGQGGPWIDQGDRTGGMQSWGNKFEGGPPASYGFDQPSSTGCSRCTVIQDNPSGPSGPPGPEGGGGFAGGGSGIEGGKGKSPPGYRGNGYDNFSPEWKLREVLQQQGSGGAPLGQVAAGGWKKEKSNSVGQWSGTIRPIEPNWGEAAGPEPPPPPVSPGGSGWGDEVKVSSQGWAIRGQSPRKIDETFRVTSGGGENWISGANSWNKGGSPEGPPSASYQGGGHGGYHEFDGSRVSGQSLNVQSGYQAWDTSRQDGWDNSGRSLSFPPGNYRQGGQEQAGLQGWGSGLGHSSSWEYGRPVEPQPQPPYTPREPDVKNPSNTDPRWGTRGPSWGFRDPPYGSESREPSWTRQNANWNKIASGSLSVSSAYGPDPPSPQKESPWGSKGGGYPGQPSPWPARGPPPMQYPNYGSSGRRPGVGCRDLGCSQAGFPRGPPQWGPSAPPSSSGGGNWGAYRDREPPPRQPSWKPSGGGGGGGGGGNPYYGDRQPPSGAPNGYQGYSPAGQGYPASGPPVGYPQQNGPPQGQGYPPRGYSPQSRPPPSQGYPSGGRYNCPPLTPPSPVGCPPASQGGPGASGYPPGGGQGGPGASGYPPGGQGGPGASGYPPGGQGGPGASGYPPGGQGGPGASGYPPGGQGGPGASGYPPGGQGGPGASGYPPGGQGNPDCGQGPSSYPPEGQGGQGGAGGCPPPGSQQFQDPHRRYNGHSGVGATLDFPGLNAYAHDSSKHGSFVHCSNHTDSDQHTHSSTSAPTSTSPP